MSEEKELNGGGGLSWKTIFDRFFQISITVVGTSVISAVVLWNRVELLENNLGIHSEAAEECNKKQDAMLLDHEKRIDDNTTTIATLKSTP